MKPFDFFKRDTKSSIGIVLGRDSDSLCVSGYTSLDKNPEIVAACKKIAELIGTITIHLMMNTEDGDVRINNELSRLIDINPVPNATRAKWMEFIVMTMLLYGRGNAIILPHTRRGYLERLEPISAGRVSLTASGYDDYNIVIDGKTYRPDDVLHFTYNPDKTYYWKGQGINVALKDVADNLKQAGATKKGFLASKWKPSVIIRVDANTEEFADPAKRAKLLENYIETDGAGQPWIVPAEQFQVETVKPLSLADLAISDTVEIDKRTVAAVLGVPPFLVGVGDYNKEEWNAFIQGTIRTIVVGIQQEMTKKLILSPDWYLRFNFRSLMDWDLQTISQVFGEGRKMGVIDGNEMRDALGLSPREGLDELVMLENYIPTDMLGSQKKLIQEGSNE